ncbi:MAG: dihydropteroate synthase [Euryarchaeota archaeon]|nr:dihydropteroate synthase [Euryarchaeota archaeon]
MILIGDRINARIKGVKEAIKRRDDSYIHNLAKKQAEKCDYLDLFAEEKSDMLWLIGILDAAGTDAKLCIDTADRGILESALSACNGEAMVMVNSVSGEEKRLSEFLPLIEDYNANCIALCMDERGIPATAEERAEVCKNVLERCVEKGIEDVYFDPLVMPISISDKNGMIALKTLEILKSMGVKTTIGLTNISYGLPCPSNVEKAFLALAFRYLDSAILNPLDEGIIEMMRACEAVIGRDRFCRNYLRAYRRV